MSPLTLLTIHILIASLLGIYNPRVGFLLITFFIIIDLSIIK